MNNSMKFIIAVIFLVNVSVVFGGGVTTVPTTSILEKKIKNNKYAVVQYRNPNCHRCIEFTKAGTFKALAKEYPQVAFIEINNTDAPDAFKANKITATPTFIYYKGGKKVDRTEGSTDIGYYEERIDSAFGLNAPQGSETAKIENE